MISAIEWVAKNGWKFMHVYRCNHRTGDWRHKSRRGAPLGKTERKWLSHYRPSYRPEAKNGAATTSPPSLNDAMENANRLLKLVLQDNSSLIQASKMTHEHIDGKDCNTIPFPYQSHLFNVFSPSLKESLNIHVVRIAIKSVGD